MEIDLFYPDALDWMWNYCIPLGQYTNSKGDNYDLGVFKYNEGSRAGNISEATVYDNDSGSYYSGELIVKGKDAIMFNSKRTEEVLKRYHALKGQTLTYKEHSWIVK